MKIFQNVRSTAENVPSIEVNVDTVYVRSSIVRVEEMDFSGWQYDEIQYKKDNYIELISNKNDYLEEEVVSVWFESLMKDEKIMNNEMDIADLWFEMIGGVI